MAAVVAGALPGADEADEPREGRVPEPDEFPVLRRRRQVPDVAEDRRRNVRVRKTFRLRYAPKPPASRVTRRFESRV